MGTIRGYIMMKRNLIALALLCILVMAFLVTPVMAGLTVAPVGTATINTVHGEITFAITIDSALANGKVLTIDVTTFNQYIESSDFTVANWEVTTAGWNGALDDPDVDYLTLTPSSYPTVAGAIVSVKFTGAVNRWSNGKVVNGNTLTVWRSDEAGYLVPGSGVDFLFNIATPSAVTAIAPPSGPVHGGTVVTITGSGFTDATAVNFGDIPVRAFTINPEKTQIRVTSPAHASGTVHVTVDTPGGTSATSDADQFTYSPVPTVSSATTNAAGTVITITFSKEMVDPTSKHNEFKYNIVRGAAHFDDQSFSSAALKGGDPTKIDLTIPDTSTAIAPGDEVTVKYTGSDVIAQDSNVLASFSGQTVTNAMPFPAPTVLSAATDAAGTVITITFSKEMNPPVGKHGDFKYQIAGVVGDQAFSAAAFNVDPSKTKIDLTISGTASKPDDDDVVTVKYSIGTVTAKDTGVLASFADQVVTNNVAIVERIAPSHGPEAGRTVVIVTGKGFTKVTGVKFGETDAGLPTVDSATQIRITSPAGGSGAVVHVKVTTPGGISATSDADRFTYDPAPIVTNINPKTGVNSGSVSFTIDGTDFVNDPAGLLTVTLRRAGYADIDATNVVWVNPTRITCDFLITGAVTGNWNIIVRNPDGQNSLAGSNNLFQMVALTVANVASNSDTSSSYETGKSTAPASVVEPEIPGAPAPEATGVVTAELSINDQGVISQSTELQSADGRASVSIDQGVVALDQITGAPVSSVSIDTLAPSDMPSVPQDNTVSFAGIAYELGPNGAQFSPAISITFTAPSGQVGQDYTVRSYDHASGTWQDLPTTYDPQTGTITAEVSHFCCFAVFTKMVTKAPAIAATSIVTPLIPTTIKPPSPTIATTFLGIVLTVINLLVTNPILVAGIVVLAVGIALMVWKQRRDRLFPKT
jgi:hypothetical protein